MSLFLIFFNLQLSIYVVLRFIYDMELMCKTFFYDEIQSLGHSKLKSCSSDFPFAKMKRVGEI